MIGKDKSCHAASEETITGNLFGAGACRSLEFAISEILFKEPAALCIPVATVGNDITRGWNQIYSPSLHVQPSATAYNPVHACRGDRLSLGFVVFVVIDDLNYMPSVVASLFMILTLRLAKTR